MLIMGKKAIKFTSKEGNEISGVRFYYTYDLADVDGVATDSVFVSDAKLDGLDVKVGDEVEVLFNRYGKVAGIRFLK